jgi:hypothetical protein
MMRQITIAIFNGSTLPRSHRWFILDVMRKSNKDWVAHLINVDPDDFLERCCNASAKCFLELGRHKSRDDAWNTAEEMIATRH